MLISAIAAVATDGTIGHAGQIPWHLPGDLQRFKRLTMGHTLIMGHRTYRSIGRPLPGRRTIILSRKSDLKIPGCDVAESFPQALSLVVDDEVFICGGEDVYRQALSLTQRLYLTEIDLKCSGDRFFPPFLATDFVSLYEQCYAEEIDYCFRILQRPACQMELTPDTLSRL